MQIFSESKEVSGSDTILYETVCRLREIFLTGTASIKDAIKHGQPVTLTGKANISKIREIIESHGRYRIRDIAISFEVYFVSTSDF